MNGRQLHYSACGLACIVSASGAQGARQQLLLIVFIGVEKLVKWGPQTFSLLGAETHRTRAANDSAAAAQCQRCHWPRIRMRVGGAGDLRIHVTSIMPDMNPLWHADAINYRGQTSQNQSSRTSTGWKNFLIRYFWPSAKDTVLVSSSRNARVVRLLAARCSRVDILSHNTKTINAMAALEAGPAISLTLRNAAYVLPTEKDR